MCDTLLDEEITAALARGRRLRRPKGAVQHAPALERRNLDLQVLEGFLGLGLGKVELELHDAHGLLGLRRDVLRV